MKPLHNNVVVREDAPKTTTASGLLIPFQAIEKNNNPELVRAEVVAVGPGIWGEKGVFIEQDIKVGDYVYFGGINYSGVKFEENGVQYRVLRHVDILLVEEAPCE